MFSIHSFHSSFLYSFNKRVVVSICNELGKAWGPHEEHYPCSLGIYYPVGDKTKGTDNDREDQQRHQGHRHKML